MTTSKSSISRLFAVNRPTPVAVDKPAEQVAATGRTVSVGVGLKESEVSEIDRLAGELGLARNALMAWALRRFLADVRSGRLDLSAQLQEKMTSRLRQP